MRDDRSGRSENTSARRLLISCSTLMQGGQTKKNGTHLNHYPLTEENSGFDHNPTSNNRFILQLEQPEREPKALNLNK